MADRAAVRWGHGGGVDLVIGDRVRVHMNAWGATVVAALLDHHARESPGPEVEIRNAGTLIGTLTRGRAAEVARDLGLKAAIERAATARGASRGG